MRIWLDDERSMPPTFDVHCKTANEAIELLKSGEVTKISLDHDLGQGCKTGYEVAKFIEESAYNGTLDKIRLAVHSQNPVGKERIRQALCNAQRYWMEKNHENH
jgi:hypothetical protein